MSSKEGLLTGSASSNKKLASSHVTAGSAAITTDTIVTALITLLLYISVSNDVITNFEKDNVQYILYCVLIPASWLTLLSILDTRKSDVLAIGRQEYQRLLTITTNLIVIFTIGALFFSTSLSTIILLNVEILCLYFFTLMFRIAIRRWLKNQPVEKIQRTTCLVIGADRTTASIAATLQQNENSGLNILAAINLQDSIDDPDIMWINAPLESAAAAIQLYEEEIDSIVLTGFPAQQAKDFQLFIQYLYEQKLAVFVHSSMPTATVDSVRHEPCEWNPSLHVVNAPTTEPLTLWTKKCIDFVLSSIALIILAPLLIVLGIAIKCDSAGPVFFTQTRIGLGGKPFKMYKFRSMYTNSDSNQMLEAANEAAGPLFKIRNDPRVTKVGRFLRKTSLDELPQLLNVARGNMSLVGPRPPLPEEVSEYDSLACKKFLVRPGITGAWQVGGRSDLDWEEGLWMDLDYVDNCRFSTDLTLLIQTIPKVVSGVGAY